MTASACGRGARGAKSADAPLAKAQPTPLWQNSCSLMQQSSVTNPSRSTMLVAAAVGRSDVLGPTTLTEDTLFGLQQQSLQFRFIDFGRCIGQPKPQSVTLASLWPRWELFGHLEHINLHPYDDEPFSTTLSVGERTYAFRNGKAENARLFASLLSRRDMVLAVRPWPTLRDHPTAG